MNPPIRDPDKTSTQVSGGSKEKEKQSRGQRPRHDTGAVLTWSALVILLLLGLYYGLRTSSNRARLTDRNLRELDRMGRSVEDQVASFLDVLKNQVRDTRARNKLDSATLSRDSSAALIPFFAGLRQCDAAAIQIDERHLTLCSDQGAGPVEGVWTLEPIQQALDTGLFDAVFLAAGKQVVLMESVRSGLRMDVIPADTTPPRDTARSMVRSVTVAGRHYELFLQPLNIPSAALREATNTTRARSEPTDTAARSEPMDTARARWVIGGLVTTARFTGERLSLGSRDLVFLGILLLLVILSLPLLRVTLIGQWEHVNVTDVYLLSLSLVLMSGLLGIALGDLTWYQRLGWKVDTQLSALATRMAGAFRQEVQSALTELAQRNDEFQERGDAHKILLRQHADTLRARIFQDESGEIPFMVNTPVPLPYLHFQMVFWTDTAGKQRAKWTPRASNTQLVQVDNRSYFTMIRERNGWTIGSDSIGVRPKRPIQFYLESFRSKTTGEHLAALSLPFCWSGSWSAQACPRKDRGVAVITTPLASLNQPVLPPGIEFAVIEPDGRTLFHSRPERNLAENFLDETNGSRALRSLVVARVSDSLNAVYMGRSVRLQVKPITGTPLTLVLVLDDRYLGTVHFQALATALAMFGSWILTLWVLFVFVELVTPGRLQWAWPARGQPQRYRALLEVLAGFALVLIVQSVLAIWFPVHPSSLLVPVQAMALGFLILSKGRKGPRHVAMPWWRKPAVLGVGALAFVTIVQVMLHWRLGDSLLFPAAEWNLPVLTPGWYLLALQLSAVGWGLYCLVRMKVTDQASSTSGQTVRGLYVASIALMLVVVAILPGCLFYEETFSENLERLVRHEQVGVVEGLRARADRLRAVDRQSGFPEAFDRFMIADPTGLAFQPFFTSTLVRQEIAPSSASAPGSLDSLSTGCRWERGATLRHALQPLIDVPAVYVDDVAAEMGNLTRRETDGLAWICANSTLQLSSRGYVLQSHLPDGLWYPTEWWLLALIVAVGLLLWTPAWVGRRIFLLNLDHAQPTPLASLPAPPTESLIIVCTRSMDREHLLDELGAIRCCDLLELIADDESQNARELRWATRGEGAICLDHFDQQLQQKSWSRPLLAHLEQLVFVDQRTVVLLTSREPSTLFPRSDEIEAEQDEESSRWIRLLGRFIEVRVTAFGSEDKSQGQAHEQPPGTDEEAPLPQAQPEQPSGFQRRWARLAMQLRERLGAALETEEAAPEDVLVYESGTNPFLQKITAQIKGRLPDAGNTKDSGEFAADTLVDRIREMADSYYHALWSILEQEEKLVVAQLAAGVVVNPKCERAVRHLLERGILVRDPELRLMNESFARFVREEIPPATVFAWERERPASAWQRLRFPILLGVGAVAAFLFATQRSTFDTVIAILSTAAVGTTAAVRLVTAARSSGGGS